MSAPAARLLRGVVPDGFLQARGRPRRAAAADDRAGGRSCGTPPLLTSNRHVVRAFAPSRLAEPPRAGVPCRLAVQISYPPSLYNLLAWGFQCVAVSPR